MHFVPIFVKIMKLEGLIEFLKPFDYAITRN